MITTLKEISERIESPNNILNKLNVVEKTRKDRVHLSKDEKVEVYTESQFEPAKAVAAKHNVSPQTVYQNKINASPEIKDAAREKITEVREAALDKLMDALGLITPEKMSKSSAKTLSSIAANLSKVAANTNKENNAGTQVQVVLYAPRQKAIDEYKIIDVA